MNTTETITPAIEKVKVHEATINLYVDMTLASAPVVVEGQYNIDTNCFYPSVVNFNANEDGELCDSGTRVTADFESFCELNGWDYSETHSLIQEAVEKRDK